MIKSIKREREGFALKGPVVIGGIGGSGTRVVAEILLKFGFYLGEDLNESLDNLSFTLLFKRQGWLVKNLQHRRNIRTGLKILEKKLATGRPFRLRERFFMRKAVQEISRFGHNPDKAGAGQWPYERLGHILDAPAPDLSQYTGWGWKEPNSHLLLPVMNEYFPGLQYIHTMRHGLDMAYSKNQQQMRNWGGLFGITPPKTPEEVPEASFGFWVRANKQAMETGRRMGEKKFLLLKFEDLCDHPEDGVHKIVRFLEIQPSQAALAEAAGLPAKPQTVGRYKDHPLEYVQEEDLQFLKSLGYEV